MAARRTRSLYMSRHSNLNVLPTVTGSPEKAGTVVFLNCPARHFATGVPTHGPRSMVALEAAPPGAGDHHVPSPSRRRRAHSWDRGLMAEAAARGRTWRSTPPSRARARGRAAAGMRQRLLRAASAVSTTPEVAAAIAPIEKSQCGGLQSAMKVPRQCNVHTSADVRRRVLHEVSCPINIGRLTCRLAPQRYENAMRVSLRLLPDRSGVRAETKERPPRGERDDRAANHGAALRFPETAPRGPARRARTPPPAEDRFSTRRVGGRRAADANTLGRRAHHLDGRAPTSTPRLIATWAREHRGRRRRQARCASRACLGSARRRREGETSRSSTTVTSSSSARGDVA
jgi:hypothetical protein